jgi:GNAT superfamily N-acetyltransferase
MEVVQVDVKRRADLRRFIEFPYQLYRDDPNWVPPLLIEQWAKFDPRRNPMMEHCQYAYFLLIDNGQVIGRIIAFVDELGLEYWKEPIGLFGAYECINDPQAANFLLTAAQNWLKEHGMKAMRGPWGFVSQEWGLVLEGFEPPPVVMAPYNPPYYNQQMKDFSLETVKDLHAFYIDCNEGYQFPDRYLTVTDNVRRRYGVKVRSVNMSNLKADIATIVKLSNIAIAGNWGFYPVTEAEGKAMARDLKRILDPNALLIAEGTNGKPIGFALAFPDINVLLRGLKGRLFPFGLFKLLWGISRLKQYRIFALGVVPEYQGKAIDSLIYRRLYEALYHKKVRLEINFVLDGNLPMLNALEKLGASKLRRYRIYQKAI